MAKKTEPWPLLQDIVPAPRSPDTSKVLNFAAIVYKKGRESCFFARSCFLWIKPVGACFKTNWFCFSFQLETYIKPVGFASQNQLVWGGGHGQKSANLMPVKDSMAFMFKSLRFSAAVLVCIRADAWVLRIRPSGCLRTGQTISNTARQSVRANSALRPSCMPPAPSV